ncbi:hypothetical protein DVH24_013971 [Malus domestica]|uniref:Leucine-rich repeat-containing N-terminal plant-type domain-containing protein n=1 Tax=Malus domestica TaxID=3750 RepID=A0A498JEV0_MALDO|nr:hypothetical protein DVH24_013971 [Malus domestica]
MFHGSLPIPPPTELEYAAADNNFTGEISPLLCNMKNLQYLDLSKNNLSGMLPQCLGNFSDDLILLLLGNDSFHGIIPQTYNKRSNLRMIDVSHNKLQRQLPRSLVNCIMLEYLVLSNNRFNDVFPIWLGTLLELKLLAMRHNGFYGVIGKSRKNVAFPKLCILDLAYNDFTGAVPSVFPDITVNKSTYMYTDVVYDVNGFTIVNNVDYQLTIATKYEKSANLQNSIPLALMRRSPPCCNSKDSFTIDKSASSDGYPKVSSWKPAEGENSTCCSWEGVKCDEKTGHVIALDLGSSCLYGSINSNSNLFRLVHLQRLNLCDNNFNYSQIPTSIRNFPSLTHLDLSFSVFSGQVPSEVSLLSNLSGVVEFQTFQNLQFLYQLQLNWNHIDFVTESGIVNSTVLQFTILGLSFCNIREFPSFLQYQKRLERLDLSRNKIRGQVPKWMWNASIETLLFLDISNNFISDQPPLVLPWVKLLCIRFWANMFHGSLPIPPPTMREYAAADNNFTGEISPLLCNMKNLQYLDLSKNNLSGMLPQCLGNFSDDLILLLLGNNSFHGIIPQTYNKGSKLRMIDVSHNKLQGQLPRSLVNCIMLEYLILSNNRFNDVFPIWLGTLLELKLLAMRHNGFYGVIGKSRKNVDFPKLRILDLAYNDFTGAVPSVFPDITVNKLTYMYTDVVYDVNGFTIVNSVDYQLTIATKGLEQYYPKIREEFASFDISCNKFEGKIPEFIGNLKELRSLNLSHNILTGSIPSSFGNLMKLESLDLSQNKLSGRIPQQLVQLNFLSNFNVSHNNLTGSIPQGTQLTSLNVTSYEGNPGLCGDPLPKKCGNPKATELPPSTVDEGDSSSASIFEFDWKIVSAGCGSGLVVGVVLADVVITRRPDLKQFHVKDIITL